MGATTPAPPGRGRSLFSCSPLCPSPPQCSTSPPPEVTLNPGVGGRRYPEGWVWEPVSGRWKGEDPVPLGTNRSIGRVLEACRRHLCCGRVDSIAGYIAVSCALTLVLLPIVDVYDRMARRIQARRLEGVDQNIWVEFVSLADQYKTVNLGQGFPNFSPPRYIREAFSKAITDEHTLLNQYTRAFGHPPLVKALAQLFGPLLGQELNPLTNVMVSVGAYGALFCAFQALVDEGDEVIIIEPFFDSYEPMTLMAGGRCVFVSLRPKSTDDGRPQSSSDWRLDLTELEAKINKKTKILVLNTPNNPLGKVFDKEELEEIANICIKYDLICISDEVYEWLVYDGKQHIRIASLPGMWDRTITIGSAGKTFSATGWKVGWAFGPDCLLKHLRTVHQNSFYHCATGAQEAVAIGLQKELERLGKPDCYFVQLRDELQKKRDRLYHCLTEVGMKPIMSQGSYFMMADISRFKSEVPPPTDHSIPYDNYFVKWMMKNKQLAAIPVSAFYSIPHKKQYENYIRFCFVKEDATLDAAEKILQKWSSESSGPADL